jgi:hypothetical protein
VRPASERNDSIFCPQVKCKIRAASPFFAYIHGFDAGIDLLCAKAKVSNPAIAQGIRELADKMAEETAETLRTLMHDKSCTIVAHSFYRK